MFSMQQEERGVESMKVKKNMVDYNPIKTN
jgi:hypothetical protein